MGSTSLNPGVSNLLETLSSLNSPTLSSPAVVSALEKAPASDIVQLSAEASQLQGVDAMFGLSDGSNGASSSMAGALASLENGSTGQDGSASAQVAGYQAAVQSAEAQTLLGNQTGGLTGSLFDCIG